MNTLYSLFLFLEMPEGVSPFPIIVVVVVLLILAFMMAANHFILKRVEKGTAKAESIKSVMQQALNMSANNVMRYDVSEQHIYQLFGNMYPEGGLSLDDWKAHVHPDDLETTLAHFRKIIYEKEQRQEFYYRWNSNYGEGEPRWVWLHDVSMPEYRRDQSVVQSVVSTLKDETQQLLEEEDEKKLAEKYRRIFEQSVMGISFYSPEGRLLNANANMRQICHFDSEEGDAFFSNAILFDVPPFSEVVDRHHVEEFWACSHSVVPERDINDYLEIRLHPINDEKGKLAYIGVAARNVSDERDIYLQAKQNDVKIREANIAIQRYEAELRYLMDNCNIRPWRASYERREIYFYQGLSVIERTMSFEEFEPYFIDNEGEIAEEFQNLEALYSKPTFILRRMRPIFGEPDEWLWVQLNTIPEYDENGKLKGTFGIMRNVTDIMKRQELLKHETERANDSGRLKSVFLANMTHEIRTPLNAIVGFSDLLQSMEGSEEKRELIHIIHNNCDMLLRLIDDILLLSNADNNAMELIPADTDVARDFDEICQTLSSRVLEAGLEFHTENPYEVCQTCLDSARIQQVIINFVTNAVKYTQQGHVRLGYRVEKRDIDGQPHDGFYLYCEDTGSGIPKDQCERVFERFVKLNDYIQGTGLGLSICKIIVEKCGGQIGVESEVGQGSTFWFWIPAEIKELKEKSIIS